MAGEFDRYNLDDRVLMALPKLKYKRPTQVQEKVIPLFMQKKNLIVEAPTGTGKTAAYGLPLISRLNLQKRNTQALILAPSRELVLQVAAALASFYEGDQLRIGAIYGGSSMKESEEVIRAGNQIVVAVPGRLKDIMAHQKLDFFWRDIKFLIMDEGDKLMEMGFQKDFDALRQHIRSSAQLGFFSATISQDAEALMRERISPVMMVRLAPREVLKRIDFSYVKVKHGDQAAYLGGLLEQEKPGQALIFCAKREEVHTITGFLRNSGFKAESYYGSLEQNERANILKRFKSGHLDYLVASDLAARGLDIEYLPAVINLSAPRQYDYYLHRVGRTGRAGKKGKVFNFIRTEVDLIYLQKHHNQIDLPLKALKVKPLEANSMRVAEEKKWTKYHLSRGKKDKVRKGDVVGFLLNHAGLTADEVGTITAYDTYTIVDMPVKGFDTLSKFDAPLKIKGKSVKVRKYGLDEQEKRAKAVKKLQKNRNEGRARRE